MFPNRKRKYERKIKMEPEVVGKRVKDLMKKQKITSEKLAKSMGIDKKDLLIKLEGKEEFYLNEMIKLKEIFKLDEKGCNDLFFRKTTEVI